MPVVHGEKLYGPPGPQNNAVLMDIISKLKKDLQQSRAENSKLVDQLNVLISLVKRAWSGEQGATMHLANIVGVPPPNFTGSEPLRNTPVPDKTRAVKNWERMAIRLLEKDYAAIQAEIKERQKLYMERRQIYMDYVIQDHKMRWLNLISKDRRVLVLCMMLIVNFYAVIVQRLVVQEKKHLLTGLNQPTVVSLGQLLTWQTEQRCQWENLLAKIPLRDSNKHSNIQMLLLLVCTECLLWRMTRGHPEDGSKVLMTQTDINRVICLTLTSYSVPR